MGKKTSFPRLYIPKLPKLSNPLNSPKFLVYQHNRFTRIVMSCSGPVLADSK